VNIPKKTFKAKIFEFDCYSNMYLTKGNKGQKLTPICWSLGKSRPTSSKKYDSATQILNVSNWVFLFCSVLFYVISSWKRD